MVKSAGEETELMDFGTRKGPPAASADIIKDATTATFAADVLEASRTVPVLVDFWAPWCQPCKQLTPLLEKVVTSYGGKVRLVKVNIDQSQAIAQQLGIQSIPTVYAFQDGRPVDAFAGPQPENALKKFIERLIAEDVQDDVAAIIETGNELLEAGDLQGAVEVFAAVLQEDRDQPEALAGLAYCYLKSGDQVRARQTLELVPPDKRALASVQRVSASLELAERADKAGDVDVLRTRVAKDPKDQLSRYDLAMALAARDEKAEALDLLLESMRLDRKWNEEAARKQLLLLFESWGPKEPLVTEGRRRLSSLLFS